MNASVKSTTALWGEVSNRQRQRVAGLPSDKKNLSVTKTEVSKRYSFSLACITFALIGIRSPSPRSGGRRPSASCSA